METEQNIPIPKEAAFSGEIPKPKEDDLPKSIIVVLVILAVAISVLGTFTVINEMGRINTAPVKQGETQQYAKVSFTVVDPNAPRTESMATARVSFGVIDKNSNLPGGSKNG